MDADALPADMALWDHSRVSRSERTIVMKRKTFSSLRLAFSASCVLSLFALSTRGQGRGRDNYAAVELPNGLVQDWSHRHALYPRVGPLQGLIAEQPDSRALQQWEAATLSECRERDNRPSRHAAKGSMHTDWSISLGTGTTSPFMYPAKFG